MRTFVAIIALFFISIASFADEFDRINKHNKLNALHLVRLVDVETNEVVSSAMGFAYDNEGNIYTDFSVVDKHVQNPDRYQIRFYKVPSRLLLKADLVRFDTNNLSAVIRVNDPEGVKSSGYEMTYTDKTLENVKEYIGHYISESFYQGCDEFCNANTSEYPLIAFKQIEARAEATKKMIKQRWVHDSFYDLLAPQSFSRKLDCWSYRRNQSQQRAMAFSDNYNSCLIKVSLVNKISVSANNLNEDHGILNSLHQNIVRGPNPSSFFDDPLASQNILVMQKALHDYNDKQPGMYAKHICRDSLAFFQNTLWSMKSCMNKSMIDKDYGYRTESFTPFFLSDSRDSVLISAPIIRSAEHHLMLGNLFKTMLPQS